MVLRSLLTLTFAFLVTSLFGGCDDHHDRVIYIDNGVLISTPPGGSDFGSLNHFDSPFASASISGSSDVDGFDFTLNQQSRIVISVESGGSLDPFVELYDDFGFFVVSDDDSGIGTDSLLVGVLEPGFYTALVWASDFSSTSGSYEITLLVGDADGSDFEEISLNQSVAANNRTFGPDATQTFVFTLPSQGFVDIETIPVAGDGDIALQIVDQLGNEVAFFDPAGTSLPSIIDEELGPGTYLLVVSNAVGADPATIDLSINVTP